MKIPNPYAVLGTVAIAAVAVIVYEVFANKKTIAAAMQTVNPLSDQNIAYQVASKVTQAVSGDAGTSLGSKLFEVFHPSTTAAEKTAIGSSSPSGDALMTYFFQTGGA